MTNPPWSPALAAVLAGMPMLGMLSYLMVKKENRVKHRTMHEWSFKASLDDEIAVCALIEDGGTKTTFMVAKRGKDEQSEIHLDLEQLELLGETISKVVDTFRPPAPPAPPPPPPFIAEQDDQLGGLSPGLYNILHAQGIRTLEELARRNAVDLLKIPRFGRGRLHEVRELLTENGLKLAGDEQAVKVDDLDTSIRFAHCCQNSKIATLGDLAKLTETELKARFSTKRMRNEAHKLLAEHGLKLAGYK